MSQHLDDDRISAMVDGRGDPDALAHVIDCVDCRRRIAAVSQLVEDPQVASEIDALTRTTTTRRLWTRKPAFAFAGLAAAAVATIVLLNPSRSLVTPKETDSAVHREAAITTAAAPRVLSQGRLTTDSLRWTSVSKADLYRLRIWDRAGNVLWTTETRDTVLAIPPQLMNKNGLYLLDVKARTGWDRWVSSSFAEFEIRLR